MGFKQGEELVTSVLWLLLLGGLLVRAVAGRRGQMQVRSWATGCAYVGASGLVLALIIGLGALLLSGID